MLTIRKEMIDSGSYRGPELRPEETVIISPEIDLVIFRDHVDLKGMSYGPKTEVFLSGGGKIRHLKCGKTMVVNGDLVAGSLDADGDVIVDGNLSTWLGDVRSQTGNICVTGDVRSAGGITAPAGAIAISGDVEREGKIYSLDTWNGASGRKISPLASKAAHDAQRAMERLGG